MDRKESLCYRQINHASADQPRYQGSPEQNLRQSSTRQQQGLYDETGDGDVAPEINYSRGTERTGDLDRQVTAEVAASHRMERPYESRRKAADKASRMYESVSGAPLEIDEGM